MRNRRAESWSRRELLGGLTLTGTASVLGLIARPLAAEPPPETTKIRLIREPTLCLAPQYVAEELLRGEGFSDIRYVALEGGLPTGRALALRIARGPNTSAVWQRRIGSAPGSIRWPPSGRCARS